MCLSISSTEVTFTGFKQPRPLLMPVGANNPYLAETAVVPEIERCNNPLEIPSLELSQVIRVIVHVSFAEVLGILYVDF